MTPTHFFRLSVLAAALVTTQAGAQTAPDAGSVLRSTPSAVAPPKAAPDIQFDLPGALQVLPGGGQVMLKSVNFAGNTLFTQSQLETVLGEVRGKTFDLAGLRALAQLISTNYHQAGYPMARAYIGQQSLEGGALHMDVVEGRYGQLVTKGDAPLAELALPFLRYSLKSGEVIHSAALERATLILNDLPGIKASPVIRPGQAVGTGDLEVQITRNEPYVWELGLDNHGNRYTGRTRSRLNFLANSPFMLGDQLSVRSLLTEQGMWYGHAGYALPLGASGLRAQMGYSHTYYELGQDFANLQASGTADVSSLGLSYPLVRSQQANLSVNASWQHKRLLDKQGAANTESSKSSQSLPIGLGFDYRDGLGGGGISYGSLTLTTGNLNLDGKLVVADSITAKSAGGFNKLALDLTRLQTMSGQWSVLARVSGQWAGKNLDSSERFDLGGPNGVRAYPVGEGNGDEGWLTQLELRYNLLLSSGMTLAPYAFVDNGAVKINHTPWANTVNQRSIGGAGLGVRGNHKSWSFDASLAWRTHGGDPQSDTRKDNPMLWLTATWRL